MCDKQTGSSPLVLSSFSISKYVPTTLEQEGKWIPFFIWLYSITCQGKTQYSHDMQFRLTGRDPLFSWTYCLDPATKSFSILLILSFLCGRILSMLLTNITTFRKQILFLLPLSPGSVHTEFEESSFYALPCINFFLQTCLASYDVIKCKLSLALH